MATARPIIARRSRSGTLENASCARNPSRRALTALSPARQQRERAAQEGDHLRVLLDEVGVLEADRQQRLGHAPAIPGGLGGGRDAAQHVVAALVAGEHQGAAARELEVEPLGLAAHSAAVACALRARSYCSAATSKASSRRRLVPRRARVTQGLAGVDEVPGGSEVRRQVDGGDGPRGGRVFERVRDPRV